jgi:hypothetical protein
MCNFIPFQSYEKFLSGGQSYEKFLFGSSLHRFVVANTVSGI